MTIRRRSDVLVVRATSDLEATVLADDPANVEDCCIAAPCRRGWRRDAISCVSAAGGALGCAEEGTDAREVSSDG
jgi:hypothetical protein